jgi:hypothetical protein
MKPQPAEYESEYLKTYVDIVPDGDILEILNELKSSTHKLLSNCSEAQGNKAYAEGKWTLKEVIGHIIDTERVFSYRAMCIARGEKQSLPSFDQDLYVVEGKFNNRTLIDIANELAAVRTANLAMFKSFDETMLSHSGLSNGKRINVKTLLYITAGHEIHHLNIIKERYL